MKLKVHVSENEELARVYSDGETDMGKSIHRHIYFVGSSRFSSDSFVYLNFNARKFCISQLFLDFMK